MRKTILAAAAAILTLAPISAEAANLIGVGIAKSNDHVYYWYSDGGGIVTSGTTSDPDAYFGARNFDLPGNYTLRASAISSGDRVYHWWDAGGGIMVVTVGTSQDPDAYNASNAFQELDGRPLLLAAGISSSDRVYYYWQWPNGSIRVTSGTSTYPNAYSGGILEGALFQQSHRLIDVAIAGSDDHVYYWWRRSSDGVILVSSGTSTNPFAYRQPYNANQP